ncbi:transcription factor bHLH76-like [Hibiscus syriacus]|uniref:Transcription factor bHLH76-like n=1 Tax=Hibiscus syriacus TaxID=106335 RepID=A0A6A2Z8B5_HIBSY|nr:transcription factor bHLH76-like [Hibiscus syriacus]
MSGVSLAMALRSEHDHTVAAGEKPERKPHQQQQSEVGSIMGSLRVIELQLVVFIMVFSISGLVPLIHLLFPAFASAYIVGLSRFAFPSRRYLSTASQDIFHGSKLFRLYVVVGTTVGLFLPLSYVLGGFARGDDHDVRAATPHLFLLSFQILTENVIGGLSLFSPPDMVWHWFGKGLAVANLLYFSINLFLFLIPGFLPQAFERYFKEMVDMQGEMSEDKRPTVANKSPTTNKKVD